jgi:hypothetical protein
LLALESPLKVFWRLGAKGSNVYSRSELSVHVPARTHLH